MLMFMFSTGAALISFFARLYVILAVLDVGMVWLAGGRCFSINRRVYHSIVKLMPDAPQDTSPLVAGRAMRFMLSINGLAVLALGLLPGALLTLVARVLP
jgi:NADH-quinone oxidoreductase subunit N